MKLILQSEWFSKLAIKLLMDPKFRALFGRVQSGLEKAQQQYDRIRGAGSKETESGDRSDEDDATRNRTSGAADGGQDKAASRPDAVAWLMLKSGDGKGQWFDLVPGEIRIGQGERCLIRIAGHEAVSPEHAMVRVTA